MLRPKKAKLYIPEVAIKLSLPETLIEDVVNFYWQEVRKSLSGLGYPRVHISNLGDFTIKHWKLDDRIQMLERWEENNKQKGLQQMTARFKTVETLFSLNEIKKSIAEEEQRKDFIKLHKKHNHVSKKQCNKNLED